MWTTRICKIMYGKSYMKNRNIKLVYVQQLVNVYVKSLANAPISTYIQSHSFRFLSKLHWGKRESHPPLTWRLRKTTFLYCFAICQWNSGSCVSMFRANSERIFVECSRPAQVKRKASNTLPCVDLRDGRHSQGSRSSLWQNSDVHSPNWSPVVAE